MDEEGIRRPDPFTLANNIRALLGFPDCWKDTQTKPFKFDGLQKRGSSAMTLEGLRTLTSYRKMACGKETTTDAEVQEHLDWLEKYLPLLDSFSEKVTDKVTELPEGGRLVVQADEILDEKTRQNKLLFEWTSPMSGQPTTYSRLKGVKLEKAMALVLYAAALREAAFLGCVELAATPLPELQGEHKGHATAAHLLRRAAGVYEYVRDTLLSPEDDSLPPDRILELQPAVLTALSKMALAEAQALTAQRGEVRGMAPLTVSALHVASMDLFEAASRELKQLAGDFSAASERLRKFLAVSSGLQEARARKASGGHRFLDQSPGLAIAELNEGTRLLRHAIGISEGENEWVVVMEEELKALAAHVTLFDRDRQVVYFEAIPKQPGKLPEGKTLAVAVPYVPQEATQAFF